MTDREKLELLNRQITYARNNCKFYAALPAAPLETLADLKNLPFTTAQDLVLHGKDMLCCSAKEVKRMVTMQTSGTTAAPKRLAFTQTDLEQTVDFFHWGMHALCDTGDKVAIFMPGRQPDGLCDLLSRGLARFGAVPLVYGIIENYRDAADFCLREKPGVLVGIPAQIRRLALTAPDIRPQRVLLSADYISPALKDTLARIWGCEVYEHFGMTETGLGCAVETPLRQGMLCRRDIWLELVEDEIVLTTLNRQAMPLIRYRTGDLGRMLPNGNLAAVLGRKAERNRALSITKLDDILFGLDEILDYRATLQGNKLTAILLGPEHRASAALRSALASYAITIATGEDSDFRFCGKRKLT